MRKLSLKKAATYLEDATVEKTEDIGSAIVVIGRNVTGVRFVMVNDCNGKVVLIEAM